MTGARTLASIAISQGKYAQGMPEFGPERMGAPMRAYNRISDANFSLYCSVVNPDIVVVLDPSLINVIDVTEGLNKGGMVIVNTNQPIEELSKKLKTNNGKIMTVDATEISLAALGRPMPNTPIIGAIIKATGVLPLDAVLAFIKHSFGEKYSPKVVEGNLAAIKKGYEELKDK